MMGEPFADWFVSAPDGLRLHARVYGPPVGAALPVVCLPGLARTAADFHDLALALASDAERPRRVLALDYRGRGLSERDPDWRRYDVRVEIGDVLATLDAAGIEEAAFVGTSRGGLIVMGLSALRPAILRGAVLNDIGPVIDPGGLARIRGYVGKLPQPRDFGQAVQALKRIMAAQFPALSEEDWRTLAEGTWTEKDGSLVAAYDPMLMKGLEALDLEAPLPALWHLFAGLRGIPVLALRGAHSDILSAEILSAMQAAHPGLETHVVPGQGHAPLLRGADLIGLLRGFLDRIEPPRAVRASPTRPSAGAR